MSQRDTKTHYRTLLDKPYLAAEDLPDQPGRGYILTIESVGRETAYKPGVGNEEVSVIEFKGTRKKYIPCKTTLEAIAAIADSKYIEDWVGVKVKLFRSITSLRGKKVPCIRIKGVDE